MSRAVSAGSTTTKSGQVLSEAEIDRLAAEAERGFDLSAWKPRPGRPSLGETRGASRGGHSPRIEARVPEALHRRVLERASREGRSVSAVVRLLLEDYARDR